MMRQAAVDPSSGGHRVRPVRWLVWALLFAFLGFVGLGLYRVRAGQLSEGTAPDFTLNVYQGGELRLSDLRGQVVLIDFWASWCVPCREEARLLEALWQAYRERGVVFIGVDYADTERDARVFLQEFNITYPTGPDLGTRISQAYRIRGVPEKFLVDRRGQLRAVIVGPASEANLRQQFEALLAEP